MDGAAGPHRRTRLDAASGMLPGAPVLVFYVACAALFTALYFQTTREFGRATLERLTAFDAELPFQHRVLVPALVALVRPWVGFVRLDVLYAGATLAAVLASLLAFRAVIRHAFEPRVGDVGALLLLYPMLWNLCVLNRFYLPYDVPAILFFCIALVGILSRRAWVLYAALIAGAFNRETICFATLAYATLRWGALPPTRILGGCALQLAAVASVKLVLILGFGERPGSGLFEWHLVENLWRMTWWSPQSLRAVLVCGGLWALLPFSWRALPQASRRLLLVAPPYLLTQVVFGVVWETRIYNELAPLVALGALPALGRARAAERAAASETHDAAHEAPARRARAGS